MLRFLESGTLVMGSLFIYYLLIKKVLCYIYIAFSFYAKVKHIRLIINILLKIWVSQLIWKIAVSAILIIIKVVWEI